MPRYPVEEALLREPNLWTPGKKPVGPVKIDWDNEIAQDMVICSLFQGDNLNINLANNSSVSFASDGVSSDTQGGNYGRRFTTTQYLDYGPNPVGATACTIAFIAAHTDTTSRIAGGFENTTHGASECSCYFPYSNGVIYWDFGGTQNNVSRVAASNWSANTDINFWVFRAGPSGMAIYVNGTRLNNPVFTAASRTPAGNFKLNTRSGPGQNIKYDLFTVSNTEWSVDKIDRWMSDPYQFLIPA